MKGVVSLSIQRAFLFRDVVPSYEMNPYYVVYFNSKNYVSETCRRGNHAPSWEESFFFELSTDYTIGIDVFHEDEKVTIKII
jgi:hypothetical protein